MKRYIFSFIIALLTYTGVSAQLPVADLVDIVFQKDGSAIDKCGHEVRKRGKCTAVWNATYNRYCGVASTLNSDYYSIKCFNNAPQRDDILPALENKKFSIETLVMITNSPSASAATEVKVFSCTQNGGFGLMTTNTSNGGGKHPWAFTVATGNTSSPYKWATGSDTPSTNTFYHLVGVYSTDGTIKLYINGQLAGSTSSNEAFNTPDHTAGNSSVHLFGDPSDTKVTGYNTLYTSQAGATGQMALARMYGKSLTDAEVKALWESVNPESTDPSTPTTGSNLQQADLFDVMFGADDSATDISANKVTVEKVGDPTTSWNAERGRFTTSTATSGETTTKYYKIPYTTSTSDKIHTALQTNKKYTLEALIKFNTDIPTSGQVKFLSNTQGGGAALTTESGTFRFMVEDGSGWKNVGSAIKPETGKFYHVVGVRNGTTISIYIDGNLIKSQTIGNGATATSNTWFSIYGDPDGASNNKCTNIHPCEIAIARMYSTALTDAQVKASFNAIRKFDLTLPQPDMFDIAFGNNNIAKDVKSGGTAMTVSFKNTLQLYDASGNAKTEITKNVSSEKWSTNYNPEYGRFVMHSDYNWGTGEVKDNNKPNYEFSYKGDNDFKKKMTNGHTIELLANVLVNPSTVVPQVDGESGKSYQEAKWLSTCEKGGVAMMVGYDDNNNATGKQEHEYMHYIIYTDGREHHIGSDKGINLQVSATDSPDGISNACAEIDNEKNSLTQTVTGLTKGWYRLSCDGFYTGSGTNSAKLFAKSGNRDEVTKDFKVLTDASALNECKESQEIAQKGDFNKLYLLNDNTAAAQMFSTAATRATTSDYKNWLDVYVGEGEDLYIGFRKESEEGQAFADNFTLQYGGEKAPIEIYQSASKSNQGAFNKDVHMTDETTEVTYNLRRIFNKDEWNALVLPVSLTAKQLKEAFGSDVKLSRLYGVNEKRPTQLLFNRVTWTDDNETVLNAHDCYVIKPSALNYLKDGETLIDNNNASHEYYAEQIGVESPTVSTAWGPLFQFKGVSQENWMPNSEKPWNWIDNSYSYTIASGGYPQSCTWERTTTGSGKTYRMRVTCYYDKPASVPAQRYIVENGKVYYLSEEYNNLYATYWSLEDVTGSTTKAFSIAFDDDETTVIHGLEAEAKAEDNRMYNLNGQRIANDAKDGYLPKGIYITNGRKVVVR